MNARRTGTAVTIVTALVLLVLPLAGCWFAVVDDGETGIAALAITMKQPAAPVTSAALLVTGPGMAPITKNVSLAESETTLEVPAGKQRTFRLLINTVSVTFMGESTVDLAAGEQTIVSLAPKLYATQIIVPDATNGRVLQVADMKGTGWVEKYGEDIGYGMGPFEPYDIDFDDRGRIYISNLGSGEVSAFVLRLDDINDNSFEPIVTSSDGLSGGVPAIAVDRTNDYLYYVDEFSSDVYRKKLGPPLGDQESFYVQSTDGLSTKGLAVDPEGYLYLVIDNGGYPEHTVIKADTRGPIEGSVPAVASYGGAEPPGSYLNDPWDVIVKPPFVYVSNTNLADWNLADSIVQLTQNLEFVKGYGQPWDWESPLLPGVFLGPRRFVAFLNPGLIVTDELGFDNTRDRLVSFKDMSGAGWTTYGRGGFGKDEFNLFLLFLMD
jgi:hypothetical protein